MKIQVIKSATIDCIKYSELKVGDCILWANWSRKILAFNEHHRVTVDDPIGDEYEEIGPFMNWYRIKSVEFMTEEI